jgi:hypothetical protein
MPAIDPDAPAALIWLPPGETATAGTFGKVQSWTLEEAVKHALQVAHDHDKVPWIKVGDDILGPDGLRQVASALRAMGMFGA